MPPAQGLNQDLLLPGEGCKQPGDGSCFGPCPSGRFTVPLEQPQDRRCQGQLLLLLGGLEQGGQHLLPCCSRSVAVRREKGVNPRVTAAITA